MSFPVVHALIDGRVLCGSSTTSTVPAHLAKHVTCRRCLASLQRTGCRHTRTRPDVAQSLDGKRRCVDCGQTV